MKIVLNITDVTQRVRQKCNSSVIPSVQSQTIAELTTITEPPACQAIRSVKISPS